MTVDCTDDVICATEQRFIFGSGEKNVLSNWMNSVRFCMEVEIYMGIC